MAAALHLRLKHGNIVLPAIAFVKACGRGALIFIMGAACFSALALMLCKETSFCWPSSLSGCALMFVMEACLGAHVVAGVILKRGQML